MGLGGSGAGLTVTLAEPNFVESLSEVAVTVNVGNLERSRAQCILPVESIAPQLAPVQPVPERLQGDGLIRSARSHNYSKLLHTHSQ